MQNPSHGRRERGEVDVVVMPEATSSGARLPPKVSWYLHRYRCINIAAHDELVASQHEGRVFTDRLVEQLVEHRGKNCRHANGMQERPTHAEHGAAVAGSQIICPTRGAIMVSLVA